MYLQVSEIIKTLQEIRPNIFLQMIIDNNLICLGHTYNQLHVIYDSIKYLINELTHTIHLTHDELFTTLQNHIDYITNQYKTIFDKLPSFEPTKLYFELYHSLRILHIKSVELNNKLN